MMSKKGSEDKQRLWTTAVKTSNCSYHYLNQILEVIIHHLSSELHGWCFSFLQDLAGWGNQFCLRWCAASSPTYMRDTIIFSSAIIVRQYLILHTHTPVMIDSWVIHRHPHLCEGEWEGFRESWQMGDGGQKVWGRFVYL